MDKTQILNKLCEYKKFTSRGQFAKFLNVPPQHVANWYARNTFDLEALIRSFPEVNPQWLISGEGDMLSGSSIVNNGANSIQSFGGVNKMSNQYQNDDFILIAKKSLENQEKTLAILNTLVTNLINTKEK